MLGDSYIYLISNMIYNIARLALRKGLSTILSQPYGQLTYTQTLTPQSDFPRVPTYRVIDLDGQLLIKNHTYNTALLLKILKTMLYVDEMDTLLLKVKSQGKISFYMTSFGEHACIVGSAAALEDRDLVYTQYRQQGAHIWRGFTIEQIINQCIGNVADQGKGRQMPVHYGSKALNNVTVSSPLTTQVPQAAGSGYAFRTSKEDRVAACYLGEGAASEGDFPTALNFAATLKSQTLFLCRNNKYAISTPVQDQYASDGIVPRAISMGIASARVDGNDALAVLHATTEARKYIVENRKPYFIQFMTYRVGDHSTSDNSALYRKDDERNEWRKKNNPINRLTKFLQSVGCQVPIEQAQRASTRKTVTQALHKCYKYKYPSILSLFDDVYDKLPAHLLEQRADLKSHLQTYGDKYPFLDKHSKE